MASRIVLAPSPPKPSTPGWICHAQACAWSLQKNPWKAAPYWVELCRRRLLVPESCWKAAEALTSSGASDETLRLLDRLEAEFKRDPQWTLLRSRALHKLGRIDAALSVLECPSVKAGKTVRKRIENLRKIQNYVQETERAFKSDSTYHNIAALRGKGAGKRCFIIGNGPSLLQQDLTLLARETTFATNWFVNHPDCERIDPTFYCVCSHTMFGGWGDSSPGKLNEDFKQLLLAKAPNAHTIFSYKFAPVIREDTDFDKQRVDFLIFDNPKKKINAEGEINMDFSTFLPNGYTVILTFCLPLALYMGFSEIYLVGCDCDYQLTSADAPKAHFYNHDLHTTQSTKFENLCREWAPGGPVFQCYEVAGREAARRGVKIYNATAGGRLEVFPRRSFESLFQS